MKLNKIYNSNVTQSSLLSNAAIKSMLKPLSKQYMWKDFGKTENRPPPPQGGPYSGGGHYDAAIEGKPRLKKYFGGLLARSI